MHLMERLVKMKMKKLLFFFLLAIAAVGCSTDDGQNTQEFMLPVVDATVPETLTLGQNVSILVKYRKPTNCHVFNGFYIDSDGYTQTVSVRSLMLDQENCADDSATLYEAPLNFVPGAAGTYHFKFWIGNDADGLPNFLEFESVVE